MPIKRGTLLINGLVFNLCAGSHALSDSVENFSDVQDDGLQGRLRVHCTGLRLNGTKTEKAEVVYGNDCRLSWRVIDPMPTAVVSLFALVHLMQQQTPSQ